MHEPAVILGIIRSALALNTHKDLLGWLQADVRQILPHDIFIAAWGDFASGGICLDVVSPLAGVRTTDVERELLLPLIGNLFESWVDSAYAPYSILLDDETAPSLPRDDESGAEAAIGRMRAAVVHGIKDERGWQDCLYVALSDKPVAAASAVLAMEILLPYIDAAFRQVRHLPIQRQDAAFGPDGAGTNWRGHGQPGIPQPDDHGLSTREHEIMHWVSIGKTNPEIGMILGISPSTVRNHLQHIYRKLDVLNRAQAVFRLKRPGTGT